MLLGLIFCKIRVRGLKTFLLAIHFLMIVISNEDDILF